MLKTAVITGASRGMGKSLAENFARSGYNLALISRDLESVSKAIVEIKDKGAYFPFKCDVNDEKELKITFEKIYQRFGSINVLINNAGINSRRTLKTERLENWFDDFQENLRGFDLELSTNLRGTYCCSYLCAGYMLKQKEGSIINISSVKAKEPTSSPGYGASKAGIIKLTRDFAKVLAPFNIRVNCISPGFIKAGMTLELTSDKQEAYKELIPQQRFGSSEEIASVAIFLASEDASYITGENINVNGGYLML